MANSGPTLPNFKKSMYEMREDELLGPDSIQKETRGQNAMNGMMPREGKYPRFLHGSVD